MVSLLDPQQKGTDTINTNTICHQLVKSKHTSSMNNEQSLHQSRYNTKNSNNNESNTNHTVETITDKNDANNEQTLRH